MFKRLMLMILRNFWHAPELLTKLIWYAYSKNASEDNKYAFIRKIGVLGCNKGNVRVHAYGISNLPEQSGYIMYPNHQGLFDVMGLVYLDPEPFGVVIKKEARKVPFLRLAVRILGGLYIDRDDVRQGMKVINEVANQVKEGRNFLIFPEGTRSRNGNQLGAFKGGSFKAATKAKCPIVPIAIIDSYLPFDCNSTKQVDVQLHFLPPITYEEYAGMKTAEIAELTRSRIEKTIAENVGNFENA